MPLMPVDVHNVVFSKSPIGKRVYHEGEVDAFLERVEAELARLIEENNDLRDRVEQLDQQQRAAPVDTGVDLRPLELPRVVMAPAPPRMREQTSLGGDHHVHVARVLGLAQEMADRLRGEAKTEADGMVSKARATSEQLLCEARSKADGMVTEARPSRPRARLALIIHGDGGFLLGAALMILASVSDLDVGWGPAPGCLVVALGGRWFHRRGRGPRARPQAW